VETFGNIKKSEDTCRSTSTASYEGLWRQLNLTGSGLWTLFSDTQYYYLWDSCYIRRHTIRQISRCTSKERFISESTTWLWRASTCFAAEAFRRSKYQRGMKYIPKPTYMYPVVSYNYYSRHLSRVTYKRI